MHYLLLWAIALLCFGFGAVSKDEVLRLTGMVSGGAIALYGLASAPPTLQIFLEMGAIMLAFPLYRRYRRGNR